MKRLLLLATGGTIAGCAENSATLNDYAAGVLGGGAAAADAPAYRGVHRPPPPFFHQPPPPPPRLRSLVGSEMCIRDRYGPYSDPIPILYGLYTDPRPVSYTHLTLLTKA